MKMGSIGVDWVLPALKRPLCGSFVWNFSSLITVSTVGIFSKVLINLFNIAKVHNIGYFNECYENRPKNVPLITVSNHYSCFDDPAIWGCLKLQQLCNLSKMRWSLAAHDICFRSKLSSYFFMLGKCIPIVRGKGVYQEAMQFGLERLMKGEWIHIFPEGRVNINKDIRRLKWGVGRLIYDSPVTPIVIPIWHIGMDDILPNKPPYILKTGKRLTVNFGQPITITSLLNELRTNNINAQLAHKLITDKIQMELLKLKLNTEALHKVYLNLK